VGVLRHAPGLHKFSIKNSLFDGKVSRLLKAQGVLETIGGT
jgi:hypothetical protein